MPDDPDPLNVTGAVARTVLVAVGGMGLVGGALSAGVTFVAMTLSLPLVPDPVKVFLLSLTVTFFSASAAAVGVSIPGTFGGPSVPAFELTPARRRCALAAGFLLWSSMLVPAAVVFIDWNTLFLDGNVPVLVPFLLMGLLFGGTVEILTGLGLLVTALWAPRLKEHVPVQISHLIETFGRRWEGVAGKKPHLTLGARGVFGLTTVCAIVASVFLFLGSSVLLANASGEPNLGVLVIVIWVILAMFLALSTVGLLVLVLTAPGPGQLLLTGPPHAERFLAQMGGVLLVIGPGFLVLQVSVPGLGSLGSLTSLGFKLVVLGTVMRAGTLVHRRLRDPPGGSEEQAAVQQ